MTPIEPEEISAFLDGELDPARAREVEWSLAADPVLQAEFRSLAHLDSKWRSAASAAAFLPDVRHLRYVEHARPWVRTTALLVLLLLLRILPKLTDTLAFGFILHGVALAIVLLLTIRHAWREHATVPNAGAYNRRLRW